MKKLMIVLVALTSSALICSMAVAGGGHGAVLDKVYLNMSDKASLQNGAKIFVNYCVGCHSAKYARYNRVAADLGIPEALLRQSLMFSTEKMGDPIATTMLPDDAQRWFGVVPPDLTLVSRVRKPDWVYTYLRAFYQDESSASGWNNLLFENVAMPHALYELQGVQRLVDKGDAAHNAGNAHAAEGAVGSQKIVGGAIFELEHPGKLSPEEFDIAMKDLTAFLVYLAEPAQMQRKKIGVFTLVFLIILMGLCYLLKKEYWRDVH